MDILYADYAATTPLDPRVLEVMMPYFSDMFYNTASGHQPGLMAQRVVMKARMDVARHLGAVMPEIIFTSGATEGINLGIIGTARAAMANGGSGRRKIVTMRTEHPAVRDAATYCTSFGCEVAWMPVDEHGRLDLDAARELIDDNTLMVSVMIVNNETGVVQDLRSIADIAHEHGAFFMTDATQGYGKVPIDVDAMGIDLLTLSGHKIYGPKGIGAMYVRTRNKFSCPMEPMAYGGAQERGLRSGTLNVPGIVGLAAAGEIALAEHAEESARVGRLRDTFEHGILQLSNTSINGTGAPRSYNISNVLFGGVNVDGMMFELSNIACSKGSACSHSKSTASSALLAMGRSEAEANSSLRFSFGRTSTASNIDRLVSEISRVHSRYLTTD